MVRFALEAEAVCFYLFILGWVGSSLLHRLSLVAESRDYSLVAVLGLLIVVASLVAGLGL